MPPCWNCTARYAIFPENQILKLQTLKTKMEEDKLKTTRLFSGLKSYSLLKVL
jgi:transcriptional regulator NrdR family protein